MVLCLYLPSGDDNEGHKYVSLLNDLNKNHPELAGKCKPTCTRNKACMVPHIAEYNIVLNTVSTIVAWFSAASWWLFIWFYFSK